MANSFMGIDIVESGLLPITEPVLKLSPDAPVTDAFRTQMNAWLLATFGERYVWHLIAGKLYANPRTIDVLKQSLGYPVFTFK